MATTREATHSAGEQAYKVQQERKGSSSKAPKRGRADGNVERETRGVALARKEASKVHQGKPKEEGTKTAAKKTAEKGKRHIRKQQEETVIEAIRGGSKGSQQGEAVKVAQVKKRVRKRGSKLEEVHKGRPREKPATPANTANYTSLQHTPHSTEQAQLIRRHISITKYLASTESICNSPWPQLRLLIADIEEVPSPSAYSPTLPFNKPHIH